MRLAAVYSCVLATALGAWAAVQFDWRPPGAAVWDTRAVLYLGGVCAFAAWVSAGGLVALTPWRRLPPRLRYAPAMAAFTVPSLIMLRTLALTPASGAVEILATVAQGLVVGAAAALALGVLCSVTPPRQEESAPALHGRLLGTLAFVAVAGAVLLATPREREDPEFQPFAAFDGPAGRLEIGVSALQLVDAELGVLRITQDGRTNALVLAPDEWDELVRLAGEARRAGARGLAIGDRHPSDPGRLTLAGGEGVRFTLSSRRGPTVAYDLAKSDYAAFDAGAVLVSDDLHG